jgi:hypothetical protein
MPRGYRLSPGMSGAACGLAAWLALAVALILNVMVYVFVVVVFCVYEPWSERASAGARRVAARMLVACYEDEGTQPFALAR